MKRLTRSRLAGVAIAAALFSAALYADNPWDYVARGNAGCNVIGCGACGGPTMNGLSCANNARYCTVQCPDGYHHNCYQDDRC